MKAGIKPRAGNYYGRRIVNSEYDEGTWIEGEEFAYPNGGFTRRVRALCDDGVTRVFMCSIPDTFFSIPAKGKIKGKRVAGFVSIDTSANIVTFTQEKD